MGHSGDGTQLVSQHFTSAEVMSGFYKDSGVRGTDDSGIGGVRRDRVEISGARVSQGQKRVRESQGESIKSQV